MTSSQKRKKSRDVNRKDRLPKVDKEREEIVFGREIDWEEEIAGGVKRFKGLSLEEAKELIEKGYLDPSGKQNAAPTAGEIVEFMEKYPDVTTHGYMVSPKRRDARITIEGVRYKGAVTEDMKEDFLNLFRDADSKRVEWYALYCWYD